MSGKWIQFWVSVVLLAAGTGIALLALLLLQGARDMSSWPTVTGTVVTSEIETRSSRGANDGGGSTFIPMVVYEYAVDGTGHTASRISLKDEEFDEAASAWKVANKYPVGSEIVVRYSPDNPSVSLLETQAPLGGVLVLALGFIVGGIGISGIVIAISR